MAFHIRSKYGSPLTAEREQQQFERALPSGIYEGMQVHHGTTGLRVSLVGGTFCINGVVIYDDADTTDIFELTDGQTHIIFVTYDGDEVKYNLKSGANPTMDPTERATGVLLSTIAIGPSETDLSNAFIINSPILPKNPDRHIYMNVGKCTCTVAGTATTFHFEDMYLSCISGTGIASTEIEGGPSSVYLNGFSVSSDTAGHAGARIVLYAIDPDEFSVGGGTVDISSINVAQTPGIFSSPSQIKELNGNVDNTFSGQDYYPYRADYGNLYIIGVIDVDSGYVSLSNGVLMPRVGSEFDQGKYSHLAEALTSTAYGTGPVYSTGGVIDVDDIIVNAATLKIAGLQEVYDSFEVGTPDGAGREVDINAGAIALNNDLTDGADRWDAALRIVLDSENTGIAGDDANGLPGQERGVDVENRNGGDRNALTYRKIAFSGLCNITYSSGRVGIFWGGQPHNSLGTSDLAILESHWVTFEGFPGGDAADKRYRLEVDFVLGSSYGYLRTVEGDANIHVKAPADFNFSFDGQTLNSVPCQVWELPVVLSENSMLKDVAVSGDIHGYGGASDPAMSLMLQRPFPTLRSFIDTTSIKSGGAPTNGCLSAPVLGNPGTYPLWGPPASTGRIDTDGRWLFSELPTQVDGSRGVRVEEISGSPVPRNMLSDASVVAGPAFASNEDDSILVTSPLSGPPICYLDRLMPTGSGDRRSFDLRATLAGPNTWTETPVGIVPIGDLLYISCDHGGGGTYLRVCDLTDGSFVENSEGLSNATHSGTPYISAFRRQIAVVTSNGSNYYINHFPGAGDISTRRGLIITDATGGYVAGLYMSSAGIFVLYATSGGDFKIAQYSLDRLALVNTVALPDHPSGLEHTGTPSMSGAFGDIFVAYQMTSPGGTISMVARFEELNLDCTEGFSAPFDMPAITGVTTDGLMYYYKISGGGVIGQPIGNPDAVWARVTNNVSQDTPPKRKYHRIMATPSWYK